MADTCAALHYDKHADTSTASRSELQKFHNKAKRALLDAFAKNATSLLDLACGRGGDVHKWRAIGIRKVVGLDVSEGSVCEARRRWNASGPSLQTVTFQTADLRSPLALHREFDVVTCMFALHYFFESEAVAHVFLENVSRHLKPGGRFIGLVPDGLAINECIKYGPFDNGIMQVTALWDGKPQCFGSPYLCCIEGTVTADSQVREYLVYASVLQSLAGKYDLHPVSVHGNVFEKGSVFHRLKPPYPEPSATCTRIFAAFAFEKKIPAVQ